MRHKFINYLIILKGKLAHFIYRIHISYSFSIRKSSPMLREQYFLFWATLLCQGITSWIVNILSSKDSQKLTTKSPVKLFNFLKSKIEDVKVLANLLNRSALIYLSLLLIHFFISWIAFPIFGLFISGLIDVSQPIRHSWKSIFSFGIFFHTLSFSIISNLVYFLIDLLIEFYLLNQTFPTSSMTFDSEKVLTIGICKTKQSFIHLQAIQEFHAITTDSSPRGQLERYKIYTAVEDEGSLSREILDWFTEDLLKLVKERTEVSLQELNTFSSILGNGINTPSINGNDELLLRGYRERTIGLVETILKKIFTSESTSGVISSNTNISASNLPEVFARRGPVLSYSDDRKVQKDQSNLPLMFEFGPILKKYTLGNCLISYWIASRKIYPVEDSNLLQISIKSVEEFICKSFNEDETGQVQLNLPKVFEATIETIKLLERISEIAVNDGQSEVVSRAEIEIDSISNLLKEMMKNISGTFKETLDDVRISLQCREFIKSL